MLKKIARNTFLLSSSQVIARGIGFLYMIFLARVLGVRDFGLYSFTLALVYNFVPVADFGLERLVLRDIARQPQDASHYLSRLFPLRTIMAMVAYFLVIILGVVLGLPLKQVFYLAVFGLALLPYNLIYLFCSFLNAREKMSYMAGANIALIILTAGLGGIFAYLNLGLMAVLLAYPLASLIVMAAFILNARRWGIGFGWKIDWLFWRKSLESSWVFAALTILAVFYLRMSLVMVGILKGPDAAGLYASAFKFVEAGILIPQALALALFPLSARLLPENRGRLKKIYLKGLGVLFLLSLLPALIFNRFPALIIGVPYGEAYLPATTALTWLSCALVLFFLNALPVDIILNSSLTKVYLGLSLLNFGLLTSFLLVLIPRFSLLGAAWAVLLAEAIGFIVNNLLVFIIFKKGAVDERRADF